MEGKDFQKIADEILNDEKNRAWLQVSANTHLVHDSTKLATSIAGALQRAYMDGQLEGNRKTLASMERIANQK